MRVSIKRAAPDDATLTNMSDAALRQLIDSRVDDRAWATLTALVVQLRARVEALEAKRK